MFHILKAVICASALLSFSQNVNAEEMQTKDVNIILGKIERLYEELNGKTATIYGAIGTLIGDQLYLKNDSGTYEVIFDAGRNARKQIQACELEWFGWKNSECRFEFDVEYQIEKSDEISDGKKIRLIVFALRER